jgi:hypothetical protein
MDRREFMGLVALSCMSPLPAAEGVAAGRGIDGSEFDLLSRELLKDWCDAMLKHQVNDPGNPDVHGMLKCPVCDWMHGRCWEAMYPMMHMARATGEEKYLESAINLFEWSKNVSHSDGRWTNDMDPDSWAGITIFGAIALAESIHYHGDLLPPEIQKEWKDRLALAAEGYIYKTFFDIGYGNINYGMTSLYGFNLIGRVLGEEKYVAHSRVLARGVREYFTEPNKLIFGESKPKHERSEKGLLPVDLGYNVEESLNGLVLYALQENDTELIELLKNSMNSHLDFMLPDGAWDNSWGTRQAKWSYWGSRTSDGCQPAFSMMADRNPAFGTAAFRNLELLKRCTADGLLHGGPHYVSHGIKPCIHHTFAHAKALAVVQDHKHSLPKVDLATPLPQDVANGVKTVPELMVSLAARGPWRATVSAYDGLYTNARKKHIQQATGGSLAVLYHLKLGPVFASSMAEYMMVEANNMQPQPGEDFPLTPRIETVKGGVTYTNLYDLKTVPKTSDDGRVIRFDILMGLYDRDYKKLDGEGSGYRVSYLIGEDGVTMHAEAADGPVGKQEATLILPLISKTGESVRLVSDRRIEIKKPEGTLVLESSAPLMIKPSKQGRIFNMVPGMECVPVLVEMPKGKRVSCSITTME